MTSQHGFVIICGAHPLKKKKYIISYLKIIQKLHISEKNLIAYLQKHCDKVVADTEITRQLLTWTQRRGQNETGHTYEAGKWLTQDKDDALHPFLRLRWKNKAVKFSFLNLLTSTDCKTRVTTKEQKMQYSNSLPFKILNKKISIFKTPQTKSEALPISCKCNWKISIIELVIFVRMMVTTNVGERH